MCGRTACTLNPDVLMKACQYIDKGGKVTTPEWKDAPCGTQYSPSPNIPPTVYTPVLVREDTGKRFLQPMMWGLIPPWHQGSDPKSHGLSTNNARLEGVEQSKLYSPSLSRRCVVVVDGFYEWKRDGAVKQPYLVYAKQANGVRIEEVRRWNNIEMGDEWTGPRLMYMAGIYSIWDRGNGWPVNSYSILTRESNSVLSWLHNRMPCFLLDDRAVSDWLDPKIDLNTVLRLPTEDELSWHTVSTKVGNSRNKDIDLVNEVQPQESKKKSEVKATTASKNLMANWLKRSSDIVSENGNKKAKTEPS